VRRAAAHRAPGCALLPLNLNREPRELGGLRRRRVALLGSGPAVAERGARLAALCAARACWPEDHAGWLCRATPTGRRAARGQPGQCQRPAGCRGAEGAPPPARPVRRLRACAGGRLVVVNLQRTPKDRRAALVIRARADCMMAGVMAVLGLRVRPARPGAPCCAARARPRQCRRANTCQPQAEPRDRCAVEIPESRGLRGGKVVPALFVLKSP
jgi:hypothetical protein